MKANKKESEYIPFGEEWKNELIKLPKIAIIALYRNLCLKESEPEQPKTEIEQPEEDIKIPQWYDKQEMYDWLILNSYSKEIAIELSQIWADDLQGAFTKRWEKAKYELRNQFPAIDLRGELTSDERKTAKEIIDGLGNIITGIQSDIDFNEETNLNLVMDGLTVILEQVDNYFKTRPDIKTVSDFEDKFNFKKEPFINKSK